MALGRDISIHTFLAEGDHLLQTVEYVEWYFNPHLPRGRRQNLLGDFIFFIKFQSTPSSRKATSFQCIIQYCINISIHTFLAEGDHLSAALTRFRRYFNPHLPRGRRPLQQSVTPCVKLFQSTPSSRKATTREIHDLYL